MEYVRATLIALSACLLPSGCGEPACTGTPDVCRFEAFQKATPDAAADAVAAIQQFQDPIVRSAAVNHWLLQHPQSSSQDGMALCALLTGTEVGNCNRRVNAAHLRR